jgi:hypothetical protein
VAGDMFDVEGASDDDGARNAENHSTDRNGQFCKCHVNSSK